jgi:hypothetical protein
MLHALKFALDLDLLGAQPIIGRLRLHLESMKIRVG